MAEETIHAGNEQKETTMDIQVTLHIPPSLTPIVQGISDIEGFANKAVQEAIDREAVTTKTKVQPSK